MNPKEIGRNIRRYRLKRGLTQEQLAETAELTSGYISRIENGVKSLRLSTLCRIAETLDTTVQSLLTSDDASSDTRILSLFADCETWERALIVDVAEATKASLKKYKAAQKCAGAGSETGRLPRRLFLWVAASLTAGVWYSENSMGNNRCDTLQSLFPN